MAEERKEEQETPEAEGTLEPRVDIKALLQKQTQLETELAQTKKGLSTAHQTIAQRDKELKRFQDLEGDITDIREMIAAGLLARENGDTLVTNPAQTVLADIEKRQQTRQTQRATNEAEASRQEYNQRANSIWARALAVLSQDADALEDVKDFLSNGLAGMAERQVAKAEKVVKPATKVSDADRQKEIEEAARKLLEESGQLQATKTNPSGGGGKVWTTSEIANMDVPTFLKTFPGGMVEVMERKLKGTVVEK